MKNLKEIPIVTGAVVGGAIGGSISLIGKVTRIKLIDELGESIIDSAIYTGSIAGTIASGATDVIAGGLQNDSAQLRGGVEDLKAGGSLVVENVIDNVKTVARNSSDIIIGAKERDVKKVVRGARTLAKVVGVSAITIGAIRVKETPNQEA